ncbi:MAG: MBL fold metallo-hydrolase [candidate division Zixibacteria bacterium]|nr:MBL fold metallo-hydrolase [candidate division Zixibacteria bacterium]
MISLAFHGAAQTVTGSKYLVRTGPESLLIDCGIFQGTKELRQQNWDKPRFDAAAIPRILLTHAHTDHTAFLPRLYRFGFRGPILCSPPTARLTEILLLDSAHLQEEDAHYLNKVGATRHKPALPLYTVEDAQAVIRQLRPVAIGEEITVSAQMKFTLRPVAHILGACSVLLRVKDATTERTIYFSGDVGRYSMPLLPDPLPPLPCNYLVVESTYGDRLHEESHPAEVLTGLVRRIVASGGVLLIPAFAVGRAQELVYILHTLQDRGDIPRLPIHVDSPMAENATEIFSEFPALHRIEVDRAGDAMHADNITYHRTRESSQAINNMAGPRVIISASGMLTGGRILHHLIHRMGHTENIIALAGYQAVGTRGRDLIDGKRQLRIHGAEHEVRAQVVDIGGLSGHADYRELMKWLAGVTAPPKKTFVTHGEPGPAAAMVNRLAQERGFAAVAPRLGEEFEL